MGEESDVLGCAVRVIDWVHSKEGRAGTRELRTMMKPPAVCMRVLSAFHALRFGTPLEDIGKSAGGVHRGWVRAIIRAYDNEDFLGKRPSAGESNQRPEIATLLDSMSAAPFANAELAQALLK